MRAFILVLVGSIGLSLVPAAMAEEGTTEDSPGRAYCAAKAEQCGLVCDRTTEQGSFAATACEAQCAIDRAACDANDAVSGVEPWLADKADKLDRFMQGFEDEKGDGTAPPQRGPDGEDNAADSCGTAHDACQARCDERFPGDEYAQAGCDSVCAMNRATCEADAGVEAAKPYVERETRRLQEFFDGLLGDEDPDPPKPSEWPSRNPDGTVDL